MKDVKCSVRATFVAYICTSSWSLKMFIAHGKKYSWLIIARPAFFSMETVAFTKVFTKGVTIHNDHLFS